VDILQTGLTNLMASNARLTGPSHPANNAAGLNASQASLIDQIRNHDADVADNLEKSLKESNDISSMLSEARDRADKLKKAEANQKISQIKEQLELLRMMAIADPEGAARQAARLAKELSSAVKSLAGMDGGSSLGVPGATPEQATAQTAVVPSAEGVAGAEGAENAAQQAQAAVPVAETQDAETPSDPQSDAEEETPSQATLTTAEEDAQAIRDAVDEQLAKSRKKANDVGEMQEFIRDIKMIKQALEQIIENAKDAENEEVKKGRAALKEVDKDLSSLENGASPLNLTTPIEMPTVPINTPVLNISI